MILPRSHPTMLYRTLLTVAVPTLLAACGGGTTASDTHANAPQAAPGATPERLGPAVPATPLPIAPPATDAAGRAAFQKIGSGWRALRYLCDGVGDGPILLVTGPGADDIARLTTLARPDLRETARSVRLGTAHAGAGSVWRELTAPGGGVIGAVRSINPGMLGDAAATTLPTLASMRIGTTETRCRWLPRARVLMVTEQRSAIITADAGDRYTYRSFDHDRPGAVSDAGERGASSTPTAEVGGGRLVQATAEIEIYEFAAPPWTYRITASSDAAAPGATLSVLRNGRLVSTAAARAYVMAARRGG